MNRVSPSHRVTPDEIVRRIRAKTTVETLPKKPGYHIADIPRGTFGEPSKIIEEAREFADAINQGVTLMALQELSDLLGAIHGYLARHHPSLTIIDLIDMAAMTERAFKNGHRD